MAVGRPTSPPVPVVVARGLGAAPALARLRADAGVEVVSSPRHATVLVIVGAVPADHVGALRLLHDQVPPPRGVATLGVDGSFDVLGPAAPRRLLPEDVGPQLSSLGDDVLSGRVDQVQLGPEDNPVEWQGVGPHGQGGEGMMGGTPYGRMMPMPPTEGRDGLALDRLSLRLGPYLPGLPDGVAVDVGLQGDVLETVSLVPADRQHGVVGTVSLPSDEPTRLLVALAELTALCGLDALARRVARVACDPDRGAVTDLRRRLDRRWGLPVATDGVGRLPDGSDATDRWRRWLDRTLAVLDGSSDPASPADVRVAEVAATLRGSELGRALVTLASLQPELSVDARSAVAT